MGTAVAVMALSACSSTENSACSAVWISSSLRVYVTGTLARVSDIGFCTGVACTPLRPSIQLKGSTPTPLPIDHQGNVWTVPIDQSRPPHVRVAAFDDSGKILASDVVSLSWKNHGRSTCPGPYTATVSLNVPV